MKTLIAIFLGGGCGSICRYLIGKMAIHYLPVSFPFGTLLANVLSCLVLGVALLYFVKPNHEQFWMSFLIIGFCGGFSTFSTFSYDTLKLMMAGKWLFVVLNVSISITVCLLILYSFVKKI